MGGRVAVCGFLELCGSANHGSCNCCHDLVGMTVIPAMLLSGSLVRIPKIYDMFARCGGAWF